MDFFENQYFSNTRFLLLLVGQWPFHESKVKQLKRVVVCTCLASFIAVQVLKFVTRNIDLDLIAETLPFVMFGIIISVKYCTCWCQSEIIKRMLLCIEYDWNAERLRNERDIMRKYTNEGLRYGKYYVRFIVFAIICSTCMVFVPPLVEITILRNGSCRHELPFDFEYIVDIQEYYYPILIHVQLCIVVGLLVIVAADVIYINFMYHACALFSIVGYRLKHLVDNVDSVKAADRDFVFYSKMVNAVEYHMKAIEYFQAILACYTYSYLLQLFAIVLAITGVLFNLHKSLTLNDMTVRLLFGLDIIGHYFLLFMNMLPAQQLTDCSAKIFNNAYDGHWYMAPLKTQKLILFVMQRAMEPHIMSFPIFLNVTLEMYAKILRLSFSFFMAIYTVER